MTNNVDNSTRKQPGGVTGKGFRAGQSGNPTGRPKGTFSMMTMLKNEIQKCPPGHDQKTYAELMVDRILKSAIQDGDVQMIKTIWAYIDGQPPQFIDVTSKKEEIKPLLVTFYEPIDKKLSDNDSNGSGMFSRKL